MGLLDSFKLRQQQKGDKVHPVTPAAAATATAAQLGTPSKTQKKKGGPMGWHKAGGYPEATLPPPAYYGRPRRRSSSSLCYCLSVFFSFLVILVILSGLTILIFYIVFQPKLPKATITNVAITRFNVTNRAGGPITSLADAHSPVLNANIAFTIQVENPNEKLGIHFKDVSVAVSYNGTEFAHSEVAPFFQAKKTSSVVTADLRTSSAPLSESQGRELQAAIGKNDIPLVARVKVGAALQVGSWTVPPIHVQVACNLRASPPTAPQGAKLLSKSCKWLG